MKKISLLSLFVALILTACGDGKSFKIKGQLPDNLSDGQLLILQEVNFVSQEVEVIDSVKVNGKEFEFKGEAKGEPTYVTITPKVPNGHLPQILVIREPGTIHVNVKSTQDYFVSGTKTNDQYQSLMTNLFKVQSSMEGGITEETKDGLLKQMLGYYFDYLKNNMQNQTGEQLFTTIAYEFSPAQAKELLKNARPAFTQKEEIQMLLKTISNKEKLSSAGIYLDVQATDKDGNPISLSQYVGKNKVVMVDFWASWCQPCLKEMPHVAALYAKYKSKGLEIVGISIDKDKEAWLKAIQANRMSWIQLNDPAGQAAETYGVQNIPFTLLISQNGKIEGMDLMGEELDKKLESLLP